MSWLNAYTKIVEIVEGAVPAPNSLNMPPRFRHHTSDLTPPARGFNVRVVSGAVAVPGLVRWRLVADVEITVFYDTNTRADALNRVQVSDYETLSAALLDPSLWGRPESGIISMALDGEDTAIEYRLTDLGFEISFPVHYERS